MAVSEADHQEPQLILHFDYWMARQVNEDFNKNKTFFFQETYFIEYIWHPKQMLLIKRLMKRPMYNYIGCYLYK